jgi:predicted AAA+ superfamily ATPase
LLGGRALRYELYPLTTAEIPDFDINRALNFGLLPIHYLDDDADLLLANYIKSYLEDEIYAEARIRNLSLFSNFLVNAAFSNGETLNYSNIASECGVSGPTVKEYFQILVDTMIGKYVFPFQKRPKRQLVSTPKFYFFDVGVVNYLLKRKNIIAGTEVYGYAFEHFIYMELNAYAHYSQKNFDITFWRTKSKVEVDFVLGEHEIAIEVKSTSQVQNQHLKNLKTFLEDYTVKQAIIVSNERFPRLVGQILILPWQEFLKRLWDGEVI